MNTNDFQHVQNKCRLQKGLAMSFKGRSGGLELMWRDGVDVTIQNYSKFYIDSLVRYENNKNVHFTGFYGIVSPSLRSSSCDMLRRIGGSVKEDWVVGRDFNAILNDAEKEAGRRKAHSQMNGFKDPVDELALVDIKPDKRWFTWANNRGGDSMINERLDRFLTSVSVIENFPFMATCVMHQTKFDHDAIVLYMWGHKPKLQNKDPRLSFKFDNCWATNNEVKNIIKSAWHSSDTNFVDKLDNMCLVRVLGNVCNSVERDPE
ncbi:hypothetical protein GOBAR_DD24343 [Gossypium barbadense]|nr:hypothetical protein GOBAR_DD24343 [Gossypium barbadense]